MNSIWKKHFLFILRVISEVWKIVTPPVFRPAMSSRCFQIDVTYWRVFAIAYTNLRCFVQNVAISISGNFQDLIVQLIYTYLSIYGCKYRYSRFITKNNAMQLNPSDKIGKKVFKIFLQQLPCSNRNARSATLFFTLRRHVSV